MRAVKILFLSLLLGAAVQSCVCAGREDLRRYIRVCWDSTVRETPAADSGHILALPGPYTVPCIDGFFDELYYWDTYFTNEGLALDGRTDLVRSNTLALLSLAERFGFVPNGNRDWYLTRSQPPYLARMVAKVWSLDADTAFVEKAWCVLEKEYAFWQQERMTPCGLNRYGANSPAPAVKEEFITTAGARLGDDFRAKGWSAQQLDKFAVDCIAECESGWDFNPRFDRRCTDFCPVDLNANLYGMECLMARFAALTGRDERIWQERAERRRTRMQEKMYDPGKDAWYDYDYVRDERSPLISAAVFSLLFNGVADRAQTGWVRSALDALECPCGLAVCEKTEGGYPCQWAYPNAWPPTTFVAVQGLLEYGFREDALRLARKYADTALQLFRRTGRLWEKTDALTGEIPAESEYGTPAMMGWSAGTFVYFDELIKKEQQ